MAKAKECELEKAVPIVDDEDENTLAAIDEGIGDAEAGRTVSPEVVRRLLPPHPAPGRTRLNQWKG